MFGCVSYQILLDKNSLPTQTSHYRKFQIQTRISYFPIFSYWYRIFNSWCFVTYVFNLPEFGLLRNATLEMIAIIYAHRLFYPVNCVGKVCSHISRMSLNKWRIEWNENIFKYYQYFAHIANLVKVNINKSKSFKRDNIFLASKTKYNYLSI